MDIYFHIRILIGLVLGLCITRILTGLTRFIQHPDRHRPSAVHLVWSFAVLLGAVHFWWWEFALRKVEVWHFGVYVFILFYAFLQFLLAALLFPDDLLGYVGFSDYFMSRRRWFFGIFALGFVLDIFDTWTKGAEYFAMIGDEYLFRLGLGLSIAVAGFMSSRIRIVTGLGLLWIVYNLSWIVRHYDILQD